MIGGLGVKPALENFLGPGMVCHSDRRIDTRWLDGSELSRAERTVYK